MMPAVAFLFSMPQSYLTADRFGAFDRAFGVGVQLGTQIVRERQEREQKLEDFARQQKAEREAEDHRAQLAKQTYAANLAEELTQKAQQLKSNINDPVLNRKSIVDERVNDQIKYLDAQDKNNQLALAAGDKDYSKDAQTFARQALQNNVATRQALQTYASQPIDPATPLAPLPTAAQFNPANDVSTLPPEQRFQPEYLKAKGGMTSYQQYLVGKDEQNRRDKRINTAHGSIKATVGALNLLNMSGDDPNADPMDPASAGKAKTNSANRAKASAAYAQNVNGAISALTDPEVIAAKAGVDPETAKVYANVLKTKLATSFTGGVPTPNQFNAFLQSVRTHGGDSPVAKAVLAITDSPYSNDATEAPAATSTASGPPAQATDDTEETQ